MADTNASRPSPSCPIPGDGGGRKRSSSSRLRGDMDHPRRGRAPSFTVASFHDVIGQIGKHSRFLWLDVACIDQENYAVKMDEIGRQASIFAKASQVYVWLWTMPISTLQPMAEDISHLNVYPRQMSPRSVPGSAPSYIVTDLGARDSHGWTVEHHEDVSAVLDLLKRLKASVNRILDDWYFSSLWTLQESFLRRQAVVLSLDAEPVTYPSDGSSMPISFIVDAL